jgi:opacity protein-like surface antigen
MKRILTAIFMIISIATASQAQDYRYELGGGLGFSGYLGDVNKSNFLQSPGFSGGAVFRYLPNTRWAVKANLTVASISGNSAENNMAFPDGATYSFSSTLCDMGVQMEFNFFDYGIGATYLKLKRITPYMTLGIGGVMASTSGQTSFAMNMPVGVGLKYKLKERLNLGIEFTMRKAFDDKLDGLSDLNGVKSSFAKNTDWSSFTMFTISYEFSKRCKTCHYVD